jgi:4'-phosphopantetheinyl transferase
LASIPTVAAGCRQGVAIVPDRLETSIDLWRVDLDGLGSRSQECLQSCLSDEETAQADRYLRAATGRQFRLTRGALRFVLAAYLDQPPSSISIGRKPMGKPALLLNHGHSELCFNVSHTESFAIIALCVGREVGVDVETPNRSLDALSLAERFFAPEEFVELRETNEPARLREFLRLWTRKEALLKGQGRGLSQDWTDVRVGSLKQNRVTIPSANLSVLWQVHDLELSTPYVGAVAIAGAGAFHLAWHNVAHLC